MNYRAVFKLVLLAWLIVPADSGVLWSLAHRPSGNAPSSTIQYSSWVVYWDDVNGKRALYSRTDHLEEVGLFAYHFDSSVQLIPARDGIRESLQEIRALPAKKQPKVFITVVNDHVLGRKTRLKDPAVVHKAIGTSASRAAHIRQLLELATGADGLEIDYERIAPAAREVFSVFIQELAQALHAEGLLLSVVVPPSLGETGAIDWNKIAETADRVKVMAYYYHSAGGAPGSLAPLPWVQALAEEALERIPREKLCMVLHLGGMDWPDGQKGVPIEYAAAVLLAARHQQSFDYDAESGSGHFQYSEQGKTHHVWIETEQGLRAKVELLRRLGVAHVGLWRLGSGDPAFWESLPFS